MRKYRKGWGRRQSWPNLKGCTDIWLERLKESRETSVGTVCVPPGIWTGQLENRNQKRLPPEPVCNSSVSALQSSTCTFHTLWRLTRKYVFFLTSFYIRKSITLFEGWQTWSFLLIKGVYIWRVLWATNGTMLCHVINHKSHMGCSGMKHGLPKLEADYWSPDTWRGLWRRTFI
jgi:hypothetical protein